MKHNAFIISVVAAGLISSSCTALGLAKSSESVADSAVKTAAQAESVAENSTASLAESSAQPAQKVDSTADTTSSDLLQTINGEWLIIQVGATSIDRDEDMPYINFDATSGNFYANNGCNTLNGCFSLDGDVISFVNVLSTMKYCPEVQFDHEINTIIADGSSLPIKVSNIGQESFLDVYGSSGKSIMRLRRGNMDFLNGYWAVESIASIDELETSADLFFDLAELKLHGNTGCNFINGSIYLDHRSANAVDFSNMGVTRMACPHTAQETAMLVALESTASVISDGNDRAMLLDASGNKLMTLHRSTIPASPEE